MARMAIPTATGFPTRRICGRTHPRGFEKRYFAEGVVNGFFETQIALLNPGAKQARVLLRLQPQSGTEVPYLIDVPAGNRRTVNSADARLAHHRAVLDADRIGRAGGRGSHGGWANGLGYGSHTETAVLTAATTWYLAEGATGGGFDLYYLIQNSNDADVQVTVTYLRPEGLPPLVKTYGVPAKSRRRSGWTTRTFRAMRGSR